MSKTKCAVLCSTVLLAAFAAEAASLDELRARAAALVEKMTLEEKCAQLMNHAPAIERLGVPAYDYWGEALHGVGRNGRATVFPMPIAMAASFDPELVQDVASAIGDESRVKYAACLENGRAGGFNTGLNLWSPNVNIFRDPRWGRGIETWGEDPFLTGTMGSAFIRGLQGDDPVYLKAAACAKHFAVHSGPEALRHTFDAQPSPKDLRETYLPAFEMCVKEGKVEAVMSAYNRVYGESATASSLLLSEILRGEWGFKGHIVSDCEAVCDIWKNHKIVKTPAEACALAIKNGLTFECGPCFTHLQEAVEQGLVSEREVSEALTRLMLCRYRLGTIGEDPECPYNHPDSKCLASDEHHALAGRMARESMVLLKNNGVLPLDPKGRCYSVSGGAAGDVFTMLGNYYGVSGRMTTYLEGIVQAVGDGVCVSYAPGFFFGGEGSTSTAWPGEEEVAIVVLGLNAAYESEEGAEAQLTGSSGDRVTLALPKNQLDHLRKVAEGREQGRKIVTVVTGGSPVDLREVAELSDAIVMAWYSGEAGGEALADLLFGKADFTGRLPITFPESATVLPEFTDYSMAGRTYKYQTKGVAYPFGYGLSYARLAADVVASEACADGAGRVTVAIRNESGRDGTAVLQLYASGPKAGAGSALKTLVAFRRVDVKAGAVEQVVLDVPAARLVDFDENGKAHALAKPVYSIQL